MVMTHAFASPSAERAAAANNQGHLGIALYQVGSARLAGLGHTLPQEAAKLPLPPSIRAWDFLSIALAVFGVDRFVPRRSAADGWTRVVTLEVELCEPEPWVAQAERLAAALRFLSGDIWHLRFRAGGMSAPYFQSRWTDRDCACLFSGGLDSLIGVMDLAAMGRHPLLISQAFPKEGPIQMFLAKEIGLADHRFEGRVSERKAPPYESSSRTRSIVFFAYGALVAPSVGGELFIPENGLIAINPPLTRRRLGSLSTRTTHPHFLAMLQEVFDAVDLNVTLTNPYADQTKGEMLIGCANREIERLAKESYSCGKGKRLNKHCGRCVPCVIRRAAFHAAGIADQTIYAADNLSRHALYDDVQAARFAAAQLAHRNVARWAAESGPLPADPARRQALVDVVRRGVEEVRVFLEGIIWP